MSLVYEPIFRIDLISVPDSSTFFELYTSFLDPSWENGQTSSLNIDRHGCTRQGPYTVRHATLWSFPSSQLLKVVAHRHRIGLRACMGHRGIDMESTDLHCYQYWNYDWASPIDRVGSLFPVLLSTLADKIFTSLSLASWSLFVSIPYGKSPQLAAISTTFLSLLFAVLAIVLSPHASTGLQMIFTLLFPSGFFVFVVSAITGFEDKETQQASERRTPSEAGVGFLGEGHQTTTRWPSAREMLSNL